MRGELEINVKVIGEHFLCLCLWPFDFVNQKCKRKVKERKKKKRRLSNANFSDQVMAYDRKK